MFFILFFKKNRHPWEKVTLAYWNKYSPQNPYVSHIKGFISKKKKKVLKTIFKKKNRI